MEILCVVVGVRDAVDFAGVVGDGPSLSVVVVLWWQNPICVASYNLSTVTMFCCSHTCAGATVSLLAGI